MYTGVFCTSTRKNWRGEKSSILVHLIGIWGSMSKPPPPEVTTEVAASIGREVTSESHVVSTCVLDGSASLQALLSLFSSSK